MWVLNSKLYCSDLSINYENILTNVENDYYHSIYEYTASFQKLLNWKY